MPMNQNNPKTRSILHTWLAQVRAFIPVSWVNSVKRLVTPHKYITALREETAILRQEIQTQRRETLKILLQTRRALAISQWTTNEYTPAHLCRPLQAEDFETFLKRFKSLHPHLYDMWASINFGVNVDEYRIRPENSCSVCKHENAPFFAGFIAPYLHGRVLDIGCGPYAVPLYLQGYPLELVSAIDPLAPFEPHPFEFVQGFAEFLPWSDSTFEVVIAATSLDHVLSLDVVRSEIIRVIKPGGMFLVWEGFVKGCPSYNPNDLALQPVDSSHLFHFDETWFEDYWRQHFDILEKLDVDGTSYFYCLRIKK